MPLAVVYNAGVEQHGIWVSEEEVGMGVSEITCCECVGTGLFELPDGRTQPCVPCKGSGVLPVVLS